MANRLEESNNNLYNLEHKKLSSLIWSYATPAIIGTTVNALYNVVDRLFIANANLTHMAVEVGQKSGEKGITAIGLLLPVMTIITAFGMLIGIGAASRISLYLGKGDKDTAERIVGNALILSLLITVTVSFVMYFFSDTILDWLSAKGDVKVYAKEFMTIFLPGAIFSTLCFSFNNMMRASGYPKKAMYTMILTVVVNIALAPIFIYKFGWGMKGAALATVSAMFVGTFFVIYHFASGKNNLKLRFKYIRFNKNITSLILTIGMSPFLIQLVASMIIFNVNSKLQHYGGDVNVSAYTIVNVVAILIVMTITGLTQGMQPIVGYNYGAGNIERVKQTVIYVIKVGILIGCVGFIIGHVFPFLVIKPFNPSPHLAEVAQIGLEYITFTAPLVGFQIVVSSFFQCIGMVKKSIFLSLTRQLIFFLPALYILPNFWGIKGVWLSFPFADVAATLVTGLVFAWQIKKFRKNNLEKI